MEELLKTKEEIENEFSKVFNFKSNMKNMIYFLGYDSWILANIYLMTNSEKLGNIHNKLKGYFNFLFFSHLLNVQNIGLTFIEVKKHSN